MKEIFKALAEFQQDIKTINKNASGYNYKFADLENITTTIKPLLKKHGLGYTQPLDGTSLKTILFHVDSGETIESLVDIPQGVELKSQNEFQVLGSAITYLRRYSLSSILGLVTDDDTDASGEQVGHREYSSGKATPKQKGFILKLLQEKGVAQDEMVNYLATQYEVSGEMTMEQAKKIINDLKEN